MQTKQSRLPSLIIGGLFIAFGIFFLSELFSWFELNSILGDFWPILVVFLGLFVMSLPNNETIGFGIGIFGFLLLLHTLGLMDSTAAKYAKVFIFILLGLAIIALATGPKKPKQ